MTQSSSLSLSLTYADGRTAGKKIDFKEDPNLMCPRLGGLYVDTADNTVWIADPCSKWVHAFDIGSDGTLTHNLDTSLTTDELYPPEGIGRLDPMYSPYGHCGPTARSCGLRSETIGMLLPYRLSDG